MVGGTVLLVEHEGPVRTYLEQQLADDGFEVLAAERGGAALDLAEEAKPDLVLLDAVLPDASGFELCSRLREGEPGRRWNRDVPVIMVSARSDPVDRVRGFARGCDDYVVKPSASLLAGKKASKGRPLASLFSLTASPIRVGATASACTVNTWATMSARTLGSRK